MIPEERLTPPEADSENERFARCEDCGDWISGGEFCYEVEGKFYCESCMQKYHFQVAPYREED